MEDVGIEERNGHYACRELLGWRPEIAPRAGVERLLRWVEEYRTSSPIFDRALKLEQSPLRCPL